MVSTSESADTCKRSTDRVFVPRWAAYLCVFAAGALVSMAIVAPSFLTEAAASFHESMVNQGVSQDAQLEGLSSASLSPIGEDSHGKLGAMNRILAGNPMWKDLRGGTIAAQEAQSFRAAYTNLPKTSQRVPMNHEAPPALNNLLVEYYHKIGVAGLMQAISDEGGQPLLQEIGHNVGMVVASQLQNRGELRDTLTVLSTQTSPWRSAIHGVMWHYLQRMGVKTGQEQWDVVLSKDACGAFVDSSPYFFTSCLHGFGHGVYQQHIDDLPSGLAICSIIGDRHAGEDAEQCATGVYMEYQAGVSHNEITKPQCIADNKFSRACFFRFYTMRGASIRRSGESMRTEDFCHDVLDPAKHADCAYGFAKAVFPQIAGQSMSDFCLGRYNNPSSKSPFGVDANSAVMCVYGTMSMQARGFETEASPEPKAPEAVMVRTSQNCQRTFSDVTLASDNKQLLRSLAQSKSFSKRLIDGCIAGAQSLNSELTLANIAWHEAETQVQGKKNVRF